MWGISISSSLGASNIARIFGDAEQGLKAGAIVDAVRETASGNEGATNR
jgi:hypothetical protein